MTEDQNEPRITKGYEELLAEATEEIDTYSVAEAIEMVDDDDVVFVDVRGATERVEHGEIPGAVHAPRGMLEFHIDPESPYFIEEFGADAEIIFHCSLGGRSALATQRAKEMGLTDVANLDGGFTAWREADGPIDESPPMM